MSSSETWGFGLSGHLSWFFTIPLIAIALSSNTPAVIVPAAILGIFVNLQVQKLGERWPEVSGGRANYTARLFEGLPLIGSYAAIGYWLAWVASAPMNAIVLTDLVQSTLVPLNLQCPDLVLKLGFTLLPYVLAFGGSRALAILHLFFVVPAVLFSLLFCLQGGLWLALSPESPGLLPADLGSLVWPTLSFVDWTKWVFFALWLTTGCETAASFVADSRHPHKTLKALSFASWLIPPIFVGTAWVIMRLSGQTDPNAGIFEIVLRSAESFWGSGTSILVTLLLTSCCLLNNATAVSNTPRILYQLSLDGSLSPVFSVVSRRGVLAPSLLVGLLVGCLILLFGDVTHIVVVTGTGWLISLMIFALGLWLWRDRPEVRWPLGWLGIVAFLAVVTLVGGWAWDKMDLLAGILIPGGILALDLVSRHLSVAWLHPNWWIRRDRLQSDGVFQDFVAVQVIVLLVLVCGAATLSWAVKAAIDGGVGRHNNELFVVLLMTIAFVAIAIACWTSLPQVAAIDEAREQAQNLFITALDTVPDSILVINEEGVITQSNPAAQALFQQNAEALWGGSLSQYIPDLDASPLLWDAKSEHLLSQAKTPDGRSRIVEATVSHRSNTKRPEYIVILRDITDQKHAEETLRNQATQLKRALDDLHKTQAQLIQTEKMSSLGQLVAGVAHEINNPVNFIYGNLNHAERYTEDLLHLLHLYQEEHHHPSTALQSAAEESDLEFLAEDLPKLLASMRMGAERIREIVKSLRIFSRLDEAEVKSVNIHEGIDSTLMILHNRLKAKPDQNCVNVIKHYGTLPMVECYAGQLNQVFMNILSNALDALDDRRSQKDFDPTITITTELTDSHSVVIRVADNGYGIPEAQQSRLFDPFFTTKPIGKGTGMGLAISYEIVTQKHQGSLRCVSQAGHGAEFWIEIPLSQSRVSNSQIFLAQEA